MPKKIPFKQVILALLDQETVFPPVYLQRFNDLEESELANLRAAWPQIEPSRRRALLEDLEELAVSDTLVLFDSVAQIALSDPEPGVRATAIRLLWESEDLDLVPFLLKTLAFDPSEEVRASAASGLGTFLYQGELEEVPADIKLQIEEALLGVMAGKDTSLIRRRALESLGYSSRPEVPALIRAAYKETDPDWVVSSLLAMSRSYDQVWEASVRREMRSPNANIQLEAIQAAGELSLASTHRILLDLLEDEGSDSEVRAAVIWSLSQIGGEETRETLEKLLDESEDDEEAEVIEAALDNLALTEQIQPQMDFFNIDLADKNHYTHIVDLEKDEMPAEDEDENDETSSTEA
jgi:HEAT repeat protein